MQTTCGNQRCAAHRLRRDSPLLRRSVPCCCKATDLTFCVLFMPFDAKICKPSRELQCPLNIPGNPGRLSFHIVSPCFSPKYKLPDVRGITSTTATMKLTIPTLFSLMAALAPLAPLVSAHGSLNSVTVGLLDEISLTTDERTHIQGFRLQRAAGCGRRYCPTISWSQGVSRFVCRLAFV